MKLSEIKGDRALDVLADIIPAITDIAADEEVTKKMGVARDVDETSRALGARRIKAAVPYLLRHHKQEIIEILATLEGVTAEQYRKDMNILSLPMALMSLLSDKDLIELFISAGQTLT